ncbi:biotin transporter BioY [Paramaledivibacter caminithermalis]|jgi:biotin transport system substrate-specific component|uniref:Biotin transporter n=1 Tax=Paramaledivibacter caminithermalis (strain DSM 15212 / CIP 107654 / DViRD3) TaxID=1121301 RepID=A0A1M6LQ82_PARC5|nr:biotin transporter BioY [Paramaledivibacter caminithermalis]SHJ73364.1 biotin transport system substrate-specific component [Paramaledivibacter caminithermalis DSM 15212]
MKLSTRDMILVALFAALTAIGAYLQIPTQPVPFTLQILFCMYAGVFLGAKLGFFSQLVYVLMGLIGLPVFAGGTGGFFHILKPTFGYLIGFIICAAIIGKLTENIGEIKGFIGFSKVFGAGIIGLFIVYAVGVPYLYGIINFYLGKSMSFTAAMNAGFYPFIIQDLVKVAIVAFTSLFVIPAIRRTGFIK